MSDIEGGEEKENLPAKLEPFCPDYQKPERNDKYSDKKYDEIDKVLSKDVSITQFGGTFVSEKALPTLLEKNNRDSAYILENQIPESKKMEEGNTVYIKSSAVAGLLAEKGEETRGAGKRERLRYAQESLRRISESPDAEKKRCFQDEYDAKELPKMKAKREALRPPDERGTCEITGEPFKQGSAFHHLDPKGLDTDPEKRLDPNAGVNINPEPHAEIHRRRLYGKEGVDQLKKEYQEKKIVR